MFGIEKMLGSCSIEDSITSGITAELYYDLQTALAFSDWLLGL